MWLTGTGIGSNTTLPGAAGEGGAVANTQVIAVNGNTITISYIPAGFGGTNQGTIASIPGGTTLTFSVPPENTNFLEPTTGTNLSSDGNPFTYAYEFGTSKTTLEQQLSLALGHPFTIYGAAVPGAAETAATSQNIMAYFPSGAGYTGYITGGWTGIDSGYPNAFGYINPTQQGSVYIAPNMTFDFTEIQYRGQDRRAGRGRLGRAVQCNHGQRCWHTCRRVAGARLRRRGVEHHDRLADGVAVYHADVHGLPRECLCEEL